MLTPEEIASIAKQAFDGENVEVVKHQISSYSNNKLGFLGDHQSLELTIRKHNGIVSRDGPVSCLRLFVKALPQASRLQSKFIRERRIFQQEALYFNKLLPMLRESFVGEDWCPKCFLANDKVLVLEDMRERGFAMIDDKTFDSEHLEAALRAQARLHAASLLAQSRLGKSPVDVCPESCVEQLYNESLQTRIWLYVDLVKVVAQRLGRDHRRVLAAFQRGYHRLLRPKDYRSKLSPVICHGDCWFNNYLFSRNQPLKAVLVDFQIIRYAPRMFDVAFLIYMTVTGDTRRRGLIKAIEAYHEELCDTLARNNPELERPSLEDLLEEYEEMKLTAFFTSVMYYPVILISKKEMEMKYGGNLELFYRQIMTRQNNKHVIELYEQDANFANRLNEVVIELVDYCEKHNIPIVEENKI